MGEQTTLGQKYVTIFKCDEQGYSFLGFHKIRQQTHDFYNLIKNFSLHFQSLICA